MVDSDRLLAAYRTARSNLLAESAASGHWTGCLSSSALATATAISALALAERHAPVNARGRFADEFRESRLSELLVASVHWLARHQNPDGGWGDSDKSLSNIATTMLVRAAFQLTGVPAGDTGLLDAADAYIARCGGVRALRQRYGRDKTFAAPILANCALAELVSWRDVPALPFELACLPQNLWRRVRMPVVSYAIPALVAIGQVRFHHRKPWNPLLRWIRGRSREKSLQVLAEKQPASGGYLEAVPLTSFVVMSLASSGQADHPVTQRGVDFLLDSVRADGSWPIDTNLATWNTTLALNALAGGGEDISKLGCLNWLLDCQTKTVHPFTGAAPGAWAWTDLSGGVPDADDTAGALLALWNWRRSLLSGAAGGGAAGDRVAGDGATDTAPTAGAGHAADAADIADTAQRILTAARRGVQWLLDLRNGDGGMPTFCRGWGELPFDRSGADLTAHALRAIHVWRDTLTAAEDVPAAQRHLLADAITTATDHGLRYLQYVQQPCGSWNPLWFGNQYQPDESNPVYGTARVLLAFRDLGRLNTPAATRGLDWLAGAQNPDGGWGGRPTEPPPERSPAGANTSATAKTKKTGTSASGEFKALRAACAAFQPGRSSVEETALAVEALASCGGGRCEAAARRGVDWLVAAVEAGTHTECSPIGFYFAKLWYYESLYPLTMTVAALGQAVRRLLPQTVPAGQTVSLGQAVSLEQAGLPGKIPVGKR